MWGEGRGGGGQGRAGGQGRGQEARLLLLREERKVLPAEAATEEDSPHSPAPSGKAAILFFFFVFLPFLGPLPRHVEVPRLGVESEL